MFWQGDHLLRRGEQQGILDLSQTKGAVESRWASRTSNPSWGINSVSGGFDPHPLPPKYGKQLVSNFLKYRREGLSPRSIDFYAGYLRLADPVIGLHVTGQDIAQFLSNLGCSNGGKHAYYRVLRIFTAGYILLSLG